MAWAFSGQEAEVPQKPLLRGSGGGKILAEAERMSIAAESHPRFFSSWEEPEDGLAFRRFQSYIGRRRRLANRAPFIRALCGGLTGSGLLIFAKLMDTQGP